MLKREWHCDSNKKRKWNFLIFKILWSIEAACRVEQPCKISVHSDHKRLRYHHFKFWAILQDRIWEKLKKGTDVEKLVRFWWKSIEDLFGPLERPCWENFLTSWQKNASAYTSVIFMNVQKSRGTTSFFAIFLPKCENIAQNTSFKGFS